MRKSIANTLAAGGVWTLHMAAQAAEKTRQLGELGHVVPVGDGSPQQVFVICGLDVFQWVCNIFMEGVTTMQVDARPIRMPTFYDRDGEELTLEQWQQLSEDEDYKRVDLWHNEYSCVSTVWTGIDPQQHGRIFETVIVHTDSNRQPHITFCHRSPTVELARLVHRQIVFLVSSGRL